MSRYCIREKSTFNFILWLTSVQKFLFNATNDVVEVWMMFMVQFVRADHGGMERGGNDDDFLSSSD